MEQNTVVIQATMPHELNSAIQSLVNEVRQLREAVAAISLKDKAYPTKEYCQIKEFLASTTISLSQFYKLRQDGAAPKGITVGGKRMYKTEELINWWANYCELRNSSR